MTKSIVRNLHSAYSIYFSQVSLILFALLINIADKAMYNIFNSFLYPNTLIETGQTKTQNTNKHKSSFNNKEID